MERVCDAEAASVEHPAQNSRRTRWLDLVGVSIWQNAEAWRFVDTFAELKSLTGAIEKAISQFATQSPAIKDTTDAIKAVIVPTKATSYPIQRMTAPFVRWSGALV